MSAGILSPLSPSRAGEPSGKSRPTPSALSVQSDILSKRTYALILRDCFSWFADLTFESVWYKENRTFATKGLRQLLDDPALLAEMRARNVRRLTDLLKTVAAV